MKTEHVIDYGQYDVLGFNRVRTQTTTTSSWPCHTVTLIAPKMTSKEKAVWRIKRQAFF